MRWRRERTSKLLELRDQLECSRSGLRECVRVDRALVEAGHDAVGDWPISPALCCSLRAILGGMLACAAELSRVQHLARLELTAAMGRARSTGGAPGALAESHASLVVKHELMLSAERALSVVRRPFGASSPRVAVDSCDRLAAARTRLQDELFQEVLDRLGPGSRSAPGRLGQELEQTLDVPQIAAWTRAAMVERALDAVEEALSRWCARPGVPPALLASYAFGVLRDAALTEWQDLVHRG